MIDHPIIHSAPQTPIQWLIFTTELAVPNPKLQRATDRRLGNLSPVEAIAALTMLHLAELGQRTVTSAAITGIAKRSIQIKTMYRLCDKSILTQQPAVGHRHLWRLCPSAIQPLKEIHSSLTALLLKATAGLAATLASKSAA